MRERENRARKKEMKGRKRKKNKRGGEVRLEGEVKYPGSQTDYCL
jgi:hypothetical protein